MSDRLSRCIICGHDPIYYSCGYGRDHWCVQCPGCLKDIQTDHKKEYARREWEAANQPTTPKVAKP